MREYLSDVQFDHKGESLLTVGAEGYKVWTTGRGILQLSLPRSLREYARATLSPDGGTLITADFQNKVAEAWDVASGQLAYSLDWHTDGVSTVTFNPSGTLLLLGSRDGSASLWRMPVTPDWRYESYDTAPYSVRFARGGTELLVGGGIGSGQVQLFDLHTGAFTQRLDGHAAAVVDARFSPDGSRIATASLDGSLGLWDAAGGQRLATMEHNPLGAYLIEFNASGNRLLSTTDSNILSDEDAVGLWNGEDGQHLAWLRHPSKITAAHFDPAGERIVTAGFDKRVRIWDAQDGRRLLELPEQGGLIASARFSRDGQRILTAAYDSAVRIFDSGDGRLLDQLVEPGIGMAGNALFSPDESQIAIATEAGDIWLWSVGKRQMKVLKGHAQLADQLRFSPDGALLFSGGVDGTLRVWDTQTGRALSMLASLGRPLASLDVDWVDSSLAAANWTQFIVIGIATERRPTAAIAAVLRCRNPWRAGADPVALVAMPPAADCAGNIERR